MYNKRKFNKINDKKVLHKVKKQWVTISLALFMMISGGAVVTHVSANAANNQSRHPVSMTLGSKKGNKNIITNKAGSLHHNFSLSKARVNHLHTHQGNLITVNNQPIKRVNNISKVGMNKANLYHGYVYNRINGPFQDLRINRPVALHSSVDLDSGHIFGYLYPGRIVKANRMFKQFGHYGNYVRYEIRLANKRNAFITGNKKFVSYVVPSRNYKYYQRRIGKLLKHTRNNTKLVKRFNRLNKQRKHSLNKYVGLYEIAYDMQQNQRHPVIVNYHNKAAKVNTHRRKTNSLVNNPVTSTSANVASNNSASVQSVAPASVMGSDNEPAYVAPISNTPVIPSASSVAPVSSSSASRVAPSSVNSSVSAKPSSASVIPSSTANNSSKSASSKAAVPSSTAKSNHSKPSSAVKPSSSKATKLSSKASAKSSSVVKPTSSKAIRPNSKASVKSSSATKPSSSSEAQSVVPSSAKSSGSKASSASVKPSSANKASSSSSKSASSKTIVGPGKSSAKSGSASASVKPSSAAKSNQSKASAKSSSASKSVIPSSKASTTPSKASNAKNANSKVASNDSSASSVNSVSANVSAIINTTFSDINKEREQNGVAPLRMNNQLQSVASMRADQLTKNFNHYNKQGQLYNKLDAEQVAPKFADYIGENISMSTLGNSYEDGENANDQWDPILYNNHNGEDMANMMNDAMMNWDSNHGNGHRKNILSRGYATIGLGVAYSPKSGRYYLAEDFSY